MDDHRLFECVRGARVVVRREADCTIRLPTFSVVVTVNRINEVLVLEYHLRKLALLTSALAVVACSSDSIAGTDFDATLGPLTASAIVSGPFSDALPDAPIVTATDARERALVIFPGATITDVDLNDIERGLTVAEVKLRPAGGGG
jgi:hypothetical protein